jgi:hypothetical protein
MVHSLLDEQQAENKQDNKINKIEQQSVDNQQYDAMAR